MEEEYTRVLETDFEWTQESRDGEELLERVEQENHSLNRDQDDHRRSTTSTEELESAS